MAINTVLVQLDRSKTNKVRLQMALAVARYFNAHIEVVYIRANPRDLIAYETLGMTASMKRSVIAAAERSATDETNEMKTVFGEFCTRNRIRIVERAPSSGNVSITWREEIGHESTIIALRGRLADLIIMDRPIKGSPLSKTLESALRETGRPVLVVPPATRNFSVQHVAIGWNGSVEAARAVAAAMSCLNAAEVVTVFTTQKRAQIHPSATDLVEYLAWHNVTTSVQILDDQSPSVGEALLAGARKVRADLLVIGAYSRTRLREVVMGGVTGHILAAAQKPVFMVH